MKTSVELNEEKLLKARSLSSANTLKELLDEALDCLIARGRRKNLASLLGTDFFDGDLSQIRKRKGKNVGR
ncbi:MAG TPA: type II toxin-antitoxin system VapB family antitoxin [Oligoflexia bacterium]|nr:type II toxin-antitoxin system VapB family antitoxin [Oligoflexia bacterium]HMP47564.1 type II toxin-antitoxin system VapB family antitoxin [Oligoflexia bacterium]